MTNWTDLKLIQKMGLVAIDADDSSEFEIGQFLLDVNNGRIYAMRSTDPTSATAGRDRIYWWGYDGYISLTFSIASFSDGQGSSQLIGGDATPGSGTASNPSQWVAGTSLAFLASYSNGPPASPFPYIVGPTEWTSAADKLAMDSPNYTAATESSAQDTNYPSSVGGKKTFTLHATDGTTSDTQATSVTFYNERCNGLSTATSLTSANINSLGSKVVTSDKNGTFTFSPSANEYIYIAYRAALGESTFTVGGIGVDLEWLTADATVSHTNSAGFTEPYHVYRSTNHSLATTTIVVS